MLINSENGLLDNLLIIIELLKRNVPDDLTDCRDIDFETLAISFKRMYRVNYRLSVNKTKFSFIIFDGQSYEAEVNISIVNEKVMMSHLIRIWFYLLL